MRYQSEPISAETYGRLVKILGIQKANEYRDRQFRKYVISFSISMEARDGLKQIATQLNFLKGGTQPGSEANANVSSLIEAIGLGYAWIVIPTPEELQDREKNAEDYPYVLTRQEVDLEGGQVTNETT